MVAVEMPDFHVVNISVNREWVNVTHGSDDTCISLYGNTLDAVFMREYKQNI